MKDELRAGPMRHAPGWQFAAMLRLERATLRRNKAIRQLLWSDIDWSKRTIHWHAETDESGKGDVTPLTREPIAIFRSLPTKGIGDVPVFQAETGARPAILADVARQANATISR